MNRASPDPLGQVAPHLVERRVEVVGRREDEGLDRHRLDRRAQLARAVVRQDQVREPRDHVAAGTSPSAGRGLVDHLDADRDVAEQVALE